MDKIINFSLKNAVAIFLMMALLFGGGVFSASTLKMESMPEISNPVLMVQTYYPAPPKDVLDLVTDPLEKGITGLEGLKKLTSTSSDNFSMITVELEAHMDAKEVQDELERKIDMVNLPEGADKPRILTYGFDDFPIYYLALSGQNGMTQTELNQLYEDAILPDFETLEGIDHVESVGDDDPVVNIKLDANAINSYELSPAQVAGLIRDALTESPVGAADFNGKTQMVRVRGDFSTLYNIENLKIKIPRGDTLLLNQIARIESITESSFIARLDGAPTISMTLFKAKDANAVDFANATDEKIAKWERENPNLKFKIIFNGATSIKDSINGMLKEGILGALFASIMILVFLRNFRMTLIVLVSIPLSIFIALICMAFLDLSLNIMTLGGMTIAVSRVVDDSIVVIENIYIQLLKRQERNESVIIYATKQVASAITSSTITTVAVFLPIALVTGAIGDIFRPFALTITVALLASLLVAITVIPLLSKLLVMNQKGLVHHESGDKFDIVVKWYRTTLLWSLKNRVKTLAMAFLAFVLSIVLVVPNLAVAFIPSNEEERQIMYELKLPRDTSIEMMDAKTRELETMLLEARTPDGNKLFTYVEALVGYQFGNEERTDYRAMLFTETAPGYDPKPAMNEYKEKIEYELPQGSEVQGVLLAEATGGGGGGFSYVLKGNDLVDLQASAAMVKAKMSEFPELTEIKDNLGESKQEVDVWIDQSKARMFGLTQGEIMGAVRSWIMEDKMEDVELNNLKYDVKIGVDEQFMYSLEHLGNAQIRTPSGDIIHLKDVAKVREIEAPAQITRENKVQSVTVTATIDSQDTGGVSGRVAAELAKLELPLGISTEVGGVSEDINEGFTQMFVAMAASVLIVYLIMVITFGNGRAPFAILFSLPLAVIGGVIGLFVTSESLNVTSLIGFLMLIGIVITNAIVMIDRVQQLREEGYSVHDALVEGGTVRLRPIIMTALATICSLMPLAIGLSKGTLISKGLAVVVIGGLTTSTVLTLYVVPIIYIILFSKFSLRNPFRRTPKPQAASH